MKLLVISPHLDDAVLSVGAAIAARADQGDDVVVATVFSEVTERARVPEDRAAVSIVGARALHLGLDDAPLRSVPLEWSALCEAEPDEGVVARVRAALLRVVYDERPVEVWAPLGCGGHIDHVACTRAALSLANVSLYEERPYARATGFVAAAWRRLVTGVARATDDIDDAGPGSHDLARDDVASAGDGGDADVDARVHFLEVVKATKAAAACFVPKTTWKRVALDVGERRARRQRAIEAYASERAVLVGPEADGGWPWTDGCEYLWRRRGAT